MKIQKYYRTLKNGDKSIYVDIYYNQHKRIRKKLDLRLLKGKDAITKQRNKETDQTADAYIAKLTIEKQNEGKGFIPSFRKDANFVEYFKKEVDLRPPDRSSWICTYKKLEKFTGGAISFADIDNLWLEEFQVFLQTEVSQITAHHYYSNIRYCLNKAVREKIISSNPCLLLPNIKKVDIHREYLTESEIIVLNNAKCKNHEVKRAFLFSCFTGLRYSDIKNLKWENIQNNSIHYRQRKTKSVEHLPLSKSANQILYLNQTIRDNIYPIDGNVFNLPSKSVILVTIKDWVKEAKINKRVSFHTARHTFATLSLTKGVDLYTVSKLLGHKDIATTQIYAKIIDEKKQQAIDKLPYIEVTQ